MTPDLHSAARDLVAREQVEGISSSEREWLDQHLAGCPECREVAAATTRALQSLKAFSVPLPPALASRTQLRLYLRVLDTQERRHGAWVLWAASAVSWAVGIASSPYVWRGFEWLGHRAGLPALVWRAGFALWWGVPALLAAAALLMDKSKLEEYRRRW